MSELKIDARFKDVLRKKFGRLAIIEDLGTVKRGGKSRRIYYCNCDCGNNTRVLRDQIISGKTKSCGCLKKEILDTRNYKHGMAKRKMGDTTYKSWCHMKERCNNANNKSFKHYGGRGIKVCKRWEKFESFLEDMGEILIGTSIDRVDNNGHYCKENCKWSTPKEQSNNKRNNIKLYFDGEELTLAQLAEKIKMNYHRAYYLYNRYGLNNLLQHVNS